MKKGKYIFIFIFSFIALCNAIETGDRSRFLGGLKILEGQRNLIHALKNENNKIKVVYFWSTWNNLNYHLFNFVNSLSEKYKKAGIVFIGISKEPERVIKNYLNKILKLNLNIAVDRKSANYNFYLGRDGNVPYFFVIYRDNRLAWKGGPIEVDRVISRVLSSTFDYEIQKKIEEHRKKMREASEILNNKEIAAEAENILKIDPTDLTAINFLIANDIRDKKFDDAFMLIKATRKKIPLQNTFLMKENFNSELNLIKALDKNKAKIKIADMFNEYMAVFADSSVDLMEMADKILENLPFEIIPLELLSRCADKACMLAAKSRKMDSNTKGIILQVTAKIYYYSGNIEYALKIQKKAQELFLNWKDKKNASLYFSYYKDVLRISNKIVKVK